MPILFLSFLTVLISLLSWRLNVWYPQSVLFVAALYLGFLLNLIAQSLNKANITIDILDDAINTQGNNGSAKWKFLHLKVSNKKRNRLLGLVLGSKMALFTKARVKFLDFESSKELFSLDGRWSTTGEPIQLMPGTTNGWVFDYGKVPGLRFEHILPGESSNLAVAIKFDNDPTFFGFSNFSYASNFKNEEWKLNQNKVKIEVDVFAGQGERVNKRFIIQNPNGSIANFTLQKID